MAAETVFTVHSCWPETDVPARLPTEYDCHQWYKRVAVPERLIATCETFEEALEATGLIGKGGGPFLYIRQNGQFVGPGSVPLDLLPYPLNPVQ